MIDTNSCHERETYDLPDKMTAFQELKFHDIKSSHGMPLRVSFRAKFVN